VLAGCAPGVLLTHSGLRFNWRVAMHNHLTVASEN
jgi:hypothetical protein